jgi:hypothetical protein
MAGATGNDAKSVAFEIGFGIGGADELGAGGFAVRPDPSGAGSHLLLDRQQA